VICWYDQAVSGRIQDVSRHASLRSLPREHRNIRRALLVVMAEDAEIAAAPATDPLCTAEFR
jgi:hypothetical protein